MHFNREELRDGMVLRVEGSSAFSRMIKAVLYGSGGSYWKRITSVFRKKTPDNTFKATHDALIRQYLGVWVACDCLLGDKAHYTPLTEYEEKVNANKCKVRISDPLSASDEERGKAVNWWHFNVRGKTYDSRGILNLGIKWIAPRWKLRQWEWAWWCTEGCRAAFAYGASLFLWKKNHPTPCTTGKRTDWEHPTFEDVSNRTITY
jgi:hypothetical protein